MENEIEVYEGGDIAINRPPEQVLDEASKAAKALQGVIEQKKDVVKMNGKVYLTFEDWQTLAKFYGLTVGVDSTEYIEYGDVRGFEATAIVKDSTGRNVSRAEAMCLNDEKNWKSKPLFQLKSMAQTRACAKALRNVLSFVAVLAGYAGTPAEEMTGEEFKKEPPKKSADKKADSAPPQVKNPDDPASDKQVKMICAIMNGLGYQSDEDKRTCAGHMLDAPGPIESFTQLTKGDASVLIGKLQAEQAN
jgi:hypothetical protein